MSAILKFGFRKRKQLRLSEVNYLNYTTWQADNYISLKQWETRTSSGPIPHPLKKVWERKQHNSMKKELYCRRVISVCPRKNGYGGISGHIWKCVGHIYDFIIWFIMSNTLKPLYKKIFGINQIVWNMRLWRWTQINLGI